MSPALEHAVDGTEKALVIRAQSGDRNAFGELIGMYMRRAYFAALALVGSHDDALDLSQEAFARAFRARHRLDPERPFYAWLYTILRRLCFNFLRNRATRRGKLEQTQGWLGESVSGRVVNQDPATSLERKELRSRLEQAINGLPDRQREVFSMKEFEGLRYKEIAELLDIPIGTVMSRLYSARRNLASTLKDVLE